MSHQSKKILKLIPFLFGTSSICGEAIPHSARESYYIGDFSDIAGSQTKTTLRFQEQRADERQPSRKADDAEHRRRADKEVRQLAEEEAEARRQQELLLQLDEDNLNAVIEQSRREAEEAERSRRAQEDEARRQQELLRQREEQSRREAEEAERRRRAQEAEARRQQELLLQLDEDNLNAVIEQSRREAEEAERSRRAQEDEARRQQELLRQIEEQSRREVEEAAVVAERRLKAEEEVARYSVEEELRRRAEEEEARRWPEVERRENERRDIERGWSLTISTLRPNSPELFSYRASVYREKAKWSLEDGDDDAAQKLLIRAKAYDQRAIVQEETEIRLNLRREEQAEWADVMKNFTREKESVLFQMRVKERKAAAEERRKAEEARKRAEAEAEAQRQRDKQARRAEEDRRRKAEQEARRPQEEKDLDREFCEAEVKCAPHSLEHYRLCENYFTKKARFYEDHRMKELYEAKAKMNKALADQAERELRMKNSARSAPSWTVNLRVDVPEFAENAAILGLKERSFLELTWEKVKNAYNELALKYHPDKNPGNAEAAAIKFNEVQAAYKFFKDHKQKLLKD